jgi:hypothetical protein
MKMSKLSPLIMITILTLSALSLAFAKGGRGFSVSPAPQVIARNKAQRLFIIGFNGSVVIHPSRTDQLTVKISKISDGEDVSVTQNILDQISVSVRNLGDSIEVRSQLPQNLGGDEVTRWTQSNHGPEVKLDISAPAHMSIEVYLTKGDVHVSQWNAPVFISSHDGHLGIDDVVGDVSLRTMLGSIKIEKVRGTVAIESYSSLVNIDDVTGKVKVRNFSGETKLHKIIGPLFLTSQKGAVNTQETSGNMVINSGLAVVHISDHKGFLTGQTDAGSLFAKVKGSANVELSSNTGPITLSVSRESQAHVLLASKGQVNAPKALEKKNGAEAKSVQGQLEGNGIGSQGGRIRLKSDSGDLSLKFL